MARARKKLCGICSITKNGGCLRSFCRIADSRFFRGYTAGYSGMLSARLTNPVLSRHPFCCTPFYVLFFALSLAAAASILPVFVPALRIPVERGVPAVEILCVHIVLRHPKRITEPCGCHRHGSLYGGRQATARCPPILYAGRQPVRILPRCRRDSSRLFR